MDDRHHGPPQNRDWIEGPIDRIASRDGMDYSPETDTYSASFDSDSESVSMAIISAVAAVSGTAPMELPSLYSIVDPDGLKAVIKSTRLGPPQSDVHVTFTVEGYTVTVHSYGTIAIQPPQQYMTT